MASLQSLVVLNSSNLACQLLLLWLVCRYASSLLQVQEKEIQAFQKKEAESIREYWWNHRVVISAHPLRVRGLIVTYCRPSTHVVCFCLLLTVILPFSSKYFVQIHFNQTCIKNLTLWERTNPSSLPSPKVAGKSSIDITGKGLPFSFEFMVPTVYWM